MPVPKSSKTAVVHQPGAQNVVSARSLGPLESSEVAINITATAVNPVDWKMRDYNAFINVYPAILGSDAAGVIADIGPDVSRFAIGDRVFFQGIIGKHDSSTFQQYCKMPAAVVSKTPSNTSDEQAAGTSLTTMAVVTNGGEQAGKEKAVVIIGGASSVGRYAIQLARLSGFERIVTNASAANHELLKRLGAHIFLDRARSNPKDFQAAISEIPLDFVFDAISAKATQNLSVQIIQATNTASSHVVTLHVVHPETIDPDATMLGQSQEPKVDIKQVLGIGSSPALRYLSEPLAKSLGGEDGYISKGLFTPNRPRLVRGGLGAVEEALDLNQKRAFRARMSYFVLLMWR